MKNPPKTGKSMRSGNAPAPYTKKQKTPFDYPSKPALRRKYPVVLKPNGKPIRKAA